MDEEENVNAAGPEGIQVVGRVSLQVRNRQSIKKAVLFELMKKYGVIELTQVDSRGRYDVIFADFQKALDFSSKLKETHWFFAGEREVILYTDAANYLIKETRALARDLESEMAAETSRTQTEGMRIEEYITTAGNTAPGSNHGLLKQEETRSEEFALLSSLMRIPNGKVSQEIYSYYQRWTQLEQEEQKLELARAIIDKVRESNWKGGMGKSWFMELQSYVQH